MMHIEKAASARLTPALLLLLLLFPVLLSGCASRFAFTPREVKVFEPDLPQGVQRVRDPELAALFERTALFYERLVGRRFNTLATYHDPKLTEFFTSPESYADYYADLTFAMRYSQFEQNTPTAAVMLELRIDQPGQAFVKVRIVGENALPLRWWESELLREDRWRRENGAWWVAPGRI